MRAGGGLLVVLALGCGGAPTPAPVEVVVKDAPTRAPLAAAPRAVIEAPPAEPLFDAEVSLRTRPAYFGALYARPPGRGVAALNPAHVRKEAYTTGPWPVVETRDGVLRVRIEHRDATLVVYVPRDDLVVVAKETHRLSLGPDDREGEEGVFVRAGTALDGERRQGRMWVALEEQGLRVEGSLPVTAVDHAFTPDDREPTEGRHLRPGSMVRTSEGRLLVTTGDAPLHVEVTAEREGESAIAFRGERLEVRGWVDTKALTDPRVSGFGGIGCRAGIGFRLGLPRVLHRGDWLREPETGVVFAQITRSRLPVGDEGAQGKGRRIRLGLEPHGRFEAWLDEADTTFGDRFEAAYRQQVKMRPVGRDEPLPSALTARWRRLISCVDDLRRRGRREPLVLDLTWQGGDHVDVPPQGMRADVHDCVQSALAELDQGPVSPVRFSLRLDPGPLPERSPRRARSR